MWITSGARGGYKLCESLTYIDLRAQHRDLSPTPDALTRTGARSPFRSSSLSGILAFAYKMKPRFP